MLLLATLHDHLIGRQGLMGTRKSSDQEGVGRGVVIWLSEFVVTICILFDLMNFCAGKKTFLTK